MTLRDSRHRRITAWTGGTLVGMAVIALTPFLLNGLAPHHLDWSRLSDVSQTYGALSVLFSAAALVGVALSIAHQARQTRIQNQEAHRSEHRDLIQLSLSDPDFIACWEPPRTRMTQQRWRQLLMGNLIVSMWSSNFKLGLLEESSARVLLEDYFRGEIGRAYWANSGPLWRRFTAAGSDRREKWFVRIAEEAYARAVACGPPVPASEYFVPSPLPQPPDSADGNPAGAGTP
ncbi:DUF6082 family protein [Streptomyces sp. NPDC053474]|uniref:DUF6082 family protein n=1 Tax=Streptomyces sp. NPDC053474 TaxID=3365704 RepID=UPI0037D86A32